MLEMPTADALARYLSLSSQQMKLTASNMANQNTPGYTRRNVTWTEGDIVSVGASTSPGVQATVTAQRDRVLQRTVQQATETSSASSTRLSALDNLQSLFNITASGDDASGINAAVSDFFSAASNVAATPSDTTAQQSLYTSAQTLASTLNRAALNRQIGASSLDDSRDTLLDQRDSLVTRLSQLVDVNTISSNNDGMNLALADGTPLVSGTTSLPLSTGMVSGAAQVYAAASTGGANVTNAIRGGSIGGALQARDEDLPAVSGQLDALAAAIATAVNTQNALGTTASGSAGTDIFSGTAAATLTVVAADPTAFASTGTSLGSNALALGNLAGAALVGGRTASDAFSSLLSNLGSTASNAQTESTADTAILSQTSTQLDSVTGVSLDQEAANLTQYQRSYEAAAKVLTIVDELLAQAINLGQQTTVA